MTLTNKYVDISNRLTDNRQTRKRQMNKVTSSTAGQDEPGHRLIKQMPRNDNVYCVNHH